MPLYRTKFERINFDFDPPLRQTIASKYTTNLAFWLAIIIAGIVTYFLMGM